MSPRFEIRPRDAYHLPDYPGIALEPAPLVSRRYGESALERMRRGLSRPLAVLGLAASLSFPASGDDEPADPPRQDGPAEPAAGDATVVRMLSRQEIQGLVSGLERLEVEVAQEIEGKVAGQMGLVTEEEGRALLEALFAKNGFAVERDVLVGGPGLDFAADGFDRTRGVGFEYGAPPEDDLAPEQAVELELERARGKRAILVLDGRSYGYNVQYMSHLPSKAEAVDRLLEDARRFLVWLAERRR